MLLISASYDNIKNVLIQFKLPIWELCDKYYISPCMIMAEAGIACPGCMTRYRWAFYSDISRFTKKSQRVFVTMVGKGQNCCCNYQSTSKAIIAKTLICMFQGACCYLTALTCESHVRPLYSFTNTNVNEHHTVQFRK